MNIDRLNKEQREAATHTEGPLLILAGAGSGKTATMTSRIAYLIRECGISPYSILAVTFTNKAAGEMRERVEEQLGGPVPSWIMTFHAMCLRILRMDAGSLEDYSGSFAIYDPTDQKAIVKSILKAQDLDEKKNPVNGILAEISRAKEEMKSPEKYAAEAGDNFKKEIIARVYRDYDKTLKKNNAMDFDDLLLNALKLFEEHPEVLKKYRQRFKYVMVDEYQDTNNTQYRLVSALAKESGNICVVGDDDQSIYAWRGADIRNILNFEKDFPGAKVIKLEQNYRSTENILDGAYSVIMNNKSRKEKKLWTDKGEGRKICYARCSDEKEEADYVAREIHRLRGPGESYRDFAVLYRTNTQSRNFEEAFSRRDIPYRVIGGIRYYERREIKDIVAYMRLVANPQDDLSMLRIINEPKRGVGPTTLSKLIQVAEQMNISLYEVLCHEEILAGLPPKSGAALGTMIEALKKYNAEKDNLRVCDIYDGLLRDTGYMTALEAAGTPEADSRIENLMEFKSVIYDYEESPPDREYLAIDGQGSEVSGMTMSNTQAKFLEEFLEKIALLSDVDNHDPNEDAVTLMTLHSAKGLEFPYVFMVGMEDGLFPSWRTFDNPVQMEEERRLCYVGMTRAMERLCMTGAEYRMMYGRGDYTRESQFMRELNPKLVEGDGVLIRKTEKRTGTEFTPDGVAGEPLIPFDNLAAAKRKVKSKPKLIGDLEPGDRVNHAKFGDGMVAEVSGKVAVIIFDKAGTKRLATDIAPLKKI